MTSPSHLGIPALPILSELQRVFSVKGLTGNISGFGGSCRHCHNYSTLPLYPESNHRRYISEGCGHIPINLCLWTWKFEFHSIFTYQKSCFFPPLKTVKASLGSLAVICQPTDNAPASLTSRATLLALLRCPGWRVLGWRSG